MHVLLATLLSCMSLWRLPSLVGGVGGGGGGGGGSYDYFVLGASVLMSLVGQYDMS